MEKAVDRILNRQVATNETQVQRTEHDEAIQAEQTARRKVLLKIVETVMWDEVSRQQYKNINLDPKMMKYYEKFQEIVERKVEGGELSEHGRGAKYMFVTINPPEPHDDECLEALKDLMESYKESYYFNNYIYAFEQRSEVEGEYHGFHVHILFELPPDKSPSDIKKCVISKIRNSRLNINPSGKNPHIRYAKTIKDVQQITNYIKGIKKETGKLGKVKIDTQWRIDNGLKQYYQQKDDALLCKETDAS